MLRVGDRSYNVVLSTMVSVDFMASNNRVRFHGPSISVGLVILYDFVEHLNSDELPNLFA